MIKITRVIAALLFSASAGFAATVDFENETIPANPGKINVGLSYVNNGVTFSSLDKKNMFLADVAGKQTAFVPDDMPVGKSFGKVFLTGDFKKNSAIGMSFGTALQSISFDIADIDGKGKQREIFNFDFLLNGSVVGNLVRTPGDGFVPNADGGITTVSYSGMFDEVHIRNRTKSSKTGKNRNIGWGLDNIQTTPVPLPAGAVLILTGLGAFGLMRRKSA